MFILTSAVSLEQYNCRQFMTAQKYYTRRLYIQQQAQIPTALLIVFSVCVDLSVHIYIQGEW